MEDALDLARFVAAQDEVMDRVRAELGRGRKVGHWMWFVFPQFWGLGRSSMAERYAIGSRAEAEAYLAHPVLGPRLIECTELVNGVEGRSVEEIFGSVDAMKFRSCMTLFGEVDATPFAAAIEKYFGGERDQLTIQLLRRSILT